MISIIAILKEGGMMQKLTNTLKVLQANIFSRNADKITTQTAASGPFWVMVGKEIRDHVLSWRFIILLALILFTCLGSLYTSITNLAKSIKPNDPANTFFFLKLFTLSDGTLPPFHVFIGFLGPLLGIALGFDAVNSEQNNGTLSRIMAQPIHRDYVINSKFVAALMVISTLFFTLGFLVMGLGLIIIGIPPTVEEFFRVVFFLMLSILYVAFWLNLSIFFSIRFRQAATSALTAIAAWLFFTIFYQIIVNIIAKTMVPPEGSAQQDILHYQHFIMTLMRLAPSQLFTDATSTLLMPQVRALGPLTMEQLYGAVPSPLPLGQSALLVWPQLSGLIAATVLCFALSYFSFMRKEIRSR
jgi:ABC-2 type transport system permease protein